MHYVMSDIHGDYDKYASMLDTIHFSDADTMFIIGDVIDRNPNGIRILNDIIDRPNVRFIMGNHEQMMLDAMFSHNPEARYLWQSNGGGPTRRDLLYKSDAVARNKILAYLFQQPYFREVEVNGRKFYLVHGWPCDNNEDKVWARPEPDTPCPFPDKTVIIGHTPVWFYGQTEGPMHIQHFPGFIDIDCGCGNKTENRRLACLRLEDMAEFYV